MSHEDAKIKNSLRRYHDELAVKKQLEIAKDKTSRKGIFDDNIALSQPHRLVKRKAMDCGNPKCSLCGNPRRNPWLKKKGRLTAQERRVFQDLETTNNKHSNGSLADTSEE